MWDLPRPGLEPVSPALAGRFSTTAPPGKPKKMGFIKPIFNFLLSLVLRNFKFVISYFINYTIQYKGKPRSQGERQKLRYITRKTEVTVSEQKV